MRVYLGLDDTDILGHKPGTGRLARDLAAMLSQAGARMIAVLRHQLLVDPRIPYTSHNSPACIVLDLSADTQLDSIVEASSTYVLARAADGSDPGLCCVPAESVPGTLVDWGLRAASEVVTKSEAIAIAQETGTRLIELGGTGDGIIGAMAAVGLTKYGYAGRFLELAGGLRDFGSVVTAGVLMESGITPISTHRNGEPVSPGATIQTGDWLRPRLIGGQPILLVEPSADGDWRCFDRKQEKHGADHHDA